MTGKERNKDQKDKLKREQTHAEERGESQGGRSTNLRDSKMMAHLLDAMEQGQDIGHYGRLTFVMVARHFMDEREILTLLQKQPEIEEKDARVMLLQIKERDYNPPKRERILEWMERQDFPICPDPDDPNGCSVYRELQFPDRIYEQIDDFWEEKVEAEE